MKQMLRYALAALLTGFTSLASAQQNGLEFDGTNDYVNFSTSVFPAYTIECWVRFTGTTTAGQNVIVHTDASGVYNTFSHQIYTDASGHFVHYLFDGAGRTLTGTTVAALNTWYHVAITASSNGFMRLYVNGSLEGTPLAIANTWTGGDRFQIGIGSPLATAFLRGTVDEVRIWSRELCAGEINSAKSGELVGPATQSGLHRYYRLNQGTAAGTNTGLTSATDASANGSNATLTNFALSGASSNWVSGTISGALSASYNGWDVLAGSNLTSSVTISGSTVASNCALIANLTPRAGTPLSGSVTTRVMLDGAVRTFSGQPYVQRHYHIEPAQNSNTATATVTLYYQQAEFTAYNAMRGALPSLPTSTSDLANAANLRISQFHGLPTGGYAPENYPRTWAGGGPARIVITPSSVTYNSTHGRWEVVIPVTGFSGFFATTAVTPLPVTIASFSATPQQDRSVALRWNALSLKAGDRFEVQRSRDGKAFATIGSVEAQAAGAFSYTDEAPLTGTGYYRLRASGGPDDVAYSQVQSVFIGRQHSLRVSPSPAHDVLRIETPEPGLSGAVVNMQGQELLRVSLGQVTTIDLRPIPAGIYLLRLSDGTVERFIKE